MVDVRCQTRRARSSSRRPRQRAQRGLRSVEPRGDAAQPRLHRGRPPGGRAQLLDRLRVGARRGHRYDAVKRAEQRSQSARQPLLPGVKRLKRRLRLGLVGRERHAQRCGRARNARGGGAAVLYTQHEGEQRSSRAARNVRAGARAATHTEREPAPPRLTLGKNGSWIADMVVLGAICRSNTILVVCDLVAVCGHFKASFICKLKI